MDRNFQRALPLVLRHEGGFVNNPRDPGGATNKGVTIASFRAYVKPKGTVEDLKKITNEQVATVYYRHYWAAVNAHDLPSGLDYSVFDLAVNSGPARAAKMLQKVLGVTQDGRIGPNTIKAAEAEPTGVLIDRLNDERLAFLKRIKDNKGRRLWDTFGKGWSRRVEEVREKSIEWVGKPADIKKVEVEVPVEVEKPTVPKQVEKEVKQKTNWLTWLFGGGFSLTGVIAWFRDADWQTLAITAGAGLVVIIALLALGEWIVRRVKSIRKAVEAD